MNALERRIRDLEAELKSTREDRDLWRRVSERLEKRDAALRLGITAVVPRDMHFMINVQHEDRDLLDVYNSLLYSFGRPIGSERLTYTRLSCPLGIS